MSEYYIGNRGRDVAYALSRRVGWPHTRAEWGMMCATGTQLIVGDGPNIAATAVVTQYAWGASLGMVLVDPSRQGQGMGTGLTFHVLKMVEGESSKPLTLTASPAAEAMYRKAGFSQMCDVAILSREAGEATTTQTVHESTCTARQVGDTFYDGCDVRVKIIGNMMREDAPHVSLATASGAVEGFAASVKRRFADGREMLAVGPVLAAPGKLGSLLDRFTAASAAPMTCFVFQNVDGDRVSEAASRRDLLKVFNARGFHEKDRLPFMSYQGRAVPFLSDRRIVSPVSLAWS